MTGFNGQDQDAPRLIACALQDYVEIACMFQYQVSLELKDGKSLIGTALTTRLNDAREESIVISTDRGGQLFEREVPLNCLSAMRVLTEDARFKRVDFTE